MPRLLVLAPAELTRDPRARRQVLAARRLGLAVVGVCGRISGEQAAPLEGADIVRVGREGRLDSARYASGLERRQTPIVRELRGVVRLGLLLVRSVRLARAGLGVGHVDIVHANDLDTLAAATVVARRRRARLVYDAHELYTEFEADPPRLQRAVASLLEGLLARRADAVVTVSAALADELHHRLALTGRPLVVMNAPELDAREPVSRSDGPLRVVYIGALGSGRPLGDLLAALDGLEGVRLTLHVVQLAPETLRGDVVKSGHGDRIEIAGPVAPHDLIETLHEHDVGVVFDRPVTRNAELSLPNKLFEYFMAGLAVVAPRLPGLATVVEEARAGVLFEPGRPDSLGRALASLAADRDRLSELRRNAREAARDRFNAASQEPILELAWGRPDEDERTPRGYTTR